MPDTVKDLIVIALFLGVGLGFIWNAGAKRKSGSHDAFGAYGITTRLSSGIAAVLFAVVLTYFLISDIMRARH